MHGLTFVWLCAILIYSDGILPGCSTWDSSWGRPTLWLASMYGLMFFSEIWLRIRGRMPSEF